MKENKMTPWIAMLALSLAPAAGSAAIAYQGDLGDGSLRNGQLTSESGWAQSSGGEVDFWSFEGAEGEQVSLLAESNATDIAFSLYTGTSDAFSQPFFFSNNNDWDLFEFITLSSTPGDESLLDFILPATGLFTLAIGGEVPDFLAEGEGPFGYNLQLQRQTAEVPLPGAGWLMLSGLTGLLIARRRKD